MVAFGLSSDPNTGLRDAVIELELLHEGPARDFVQHCKQFDQQRERGLIAGPQQSKEEWALEHARLAKDSPAIARDFKINGLLWCPFPSKSMTVREALAIVNDPDNGGVTLWPHSTFFVQLGHALRGGLRQADDRQFFKFHGLIRNLAAGAKLSHIDVTSDVRAGSHAMFECGNREVIFDLDTRKAPTSPIQLIIVLQAQRGSSVYCFEEKDRPPGVERLSGIHGGSLSGMHRGYFSHRIKQNGAYSNKAATKFEIRDIPPEQRMPDEKGVTWATETIAFDFPAVRRQLREIGALSVADAYSSMLSRIDDAADVVEVFGIKLPIVTSLTVVALALPVLGLLFIAGLRAHGRAAVPEALQGLPRAVLGVAVGAGLCIAPAVGLYLVSLRIQLSFPQLASMLQPAAVAWAAASLVVLALALRKRSRADDSG